MATRAHLDTIRDVVPAADGCEDCLAANSTVWVHLRVCQPCGHVGCCDSSPQRHANKHFRSTQHPIIRSFEPAAEWFWCFADEVSFEVEDAPPAPSHS